MKRAARALAAPVSIAAVLVVLHEALGAWLVARDPIALGVSGRPATALAAVAGLVALRVLVLFVVPPWVAVRLAHRWLLRAKQATQTHGDP